MDFIVLSLGTNVGDREANLGKARELLSGQGIAIEQLSSVYETEPYGIAEQGYFLNQVLSVGTEKNPGELLETCLEVENAMGRVRHEKNGPRIIDVDLLFYRDEVIDSERLRIPHPGIPERRFVLQPLVEMAAEQIHPVLKKTARELLGECADTLQVKKYS